jgi:hypothetical protein
MNANRISLLITLSVLLITQVSYSEGIFGSYVVSGKAYDSRGNLLKDRVISVDDGKQIREIRLDEEGNYLVEVIYGTACRSVKRGNSYRRATREMNTRKLIFSLMGERVEIRVNWKKGARFQTIERTLCFKLKQ